MKIFLTAFIAAFIASIAISFFGGRRFDTLEEMLKIYVFTPLLIATGAGFLVYFFKRGKAQ